MIGRTAPTGDSEPVAGGGAPFCPASGRLCVARLFVTFGAFPLLALLTWAGSTSTQPGGDEWKYDVVVRKKGPPLRGLVVEQSAQYVTIKCVTRNPGRPTIIFEEAIPRRDVEGVSLLDPKERDVLVKRIDAVRKERDLLAARLKLIDPGSKPPSDAADLVELKPMDWPPNPKVRALAFQQSKHFHLISTAREELVQLTAIQLELVYDDYARSLPVRYPRAQPTTILLTRSVTDYAVLVRSQGANFLNPAFFDVANNRVLCGSDLERFRDE